MDINDQDLSSATDMDEWILMIRICLPLGAWSTGHERLKQCAFIVTIIITAVIVCHRVRGNKPRSTRTAQECSTSPRATTCKLLLRSLWLWQSVSGRRLLMYHLALAPTPQVWTVGKLQALLYGISFLQTLPDLFTPLKGHSLSPHSCPLTGSCSAFRKVRVLKWL